ncbi:hypothetical protein [Microcoleus sp. B4-C1]|uniref:hypothetical protein n=1 Tax=Microcoleus sp. B4-C1 TaxID=2818660 RepID=UPI002FD2B067
MLWRTDYITDAGKIFYFVSLVVTEELFLPTIFVSSAIKGTGFCSLPPTVTPRHATLWDATGREYTIEYPFQPTTPQWIEFWREIKANPLIISSRGMGETIKGLK